MAERPNIKDLTRQVLLNGTSSITDETGNKGYKAEIVVAGALLRIAEVLEQQPASGMSRPPVAVSPAGACQTELVVSGNNLARFRRFVATRPDWYGVRVVSVREGDPKPGDDLYGRQQLVLVEVPKAWVLFYLGEEWAGGQWQEGGPASA